MRRRSAAIAVTAALIGSAVTVATTQLVSGATTAQETVFIPTVPCRLIDTRPDTNIGPRSTPLPANQPITFNAHDGSDADSTCTIPNSATAVSTNVTAVGANAPSFLTLYPTGTDRPTTSNLNYLPGAPPTPNAVNLPLASNGQFDVFNRNGTIDVIIDINGYYQPSTNIGATGPAGPAGPRGPAGSVDTGHHRLPVNGDRDIDAPDVVIGRSGTPLIAYVPASENALKVATCTNTVCGHVTTNTIDSARRVAPSIAMAIGTNGLAAIAYQDLDTDNLHLARCRDTECIGSTTQVADASGDVLGSPAIAIGQTGRPIVAYRTDTAGALRVAECTDAACSLILSREIDAMGDVGWGAALTIGSNGNPIITYGDRANDLLKIAVCSDASCTDATIRTLIAGSVDVFTTSVTIGDDGNPLVVYGQSDRTMLAACTDPTCSSATHREISPARPSSPVIAIGDDGNPLVVDTPAGLLEIVICADPGCATTTVNEPDPSDAIGDGADIAIGIDGRPVIVYDRGPLTALVCGNSTCATFTPRTS